MVKLTILRKAYKAEDEQKWAIEAEKVFKKRKQEKEDEDMREWQKVGWYV